MSGDRRLADAERSGFQPRVEAYGEGAVIVVLGDGPNIAINRAVHRLADAVGRLRSGDDDRASPLGRRQRAGIGRPVAGLATLLVPFDPEAIDGDGVRTLLMPLVDRLAEVEAPADSNAEPLQIAVHYGGDDGPDLVPLAEQHGLRPSDVVELHSATTYEVLFLGFAPGFGYLGFVPAEIASPRRSTPRPRVAAGSVGIAGHQTCVYPSATPGGWNLIGRTSTSMWDAGQTEPALLRPGRRVRFVPER
jgi:KipI family sensor histidine kinase inhibitor